jgi:hypothetical protein
VLAPTKSECSLPYVKQPLHRLGRVLRVPEGRSPLIYRQSAHDSGKVASCFYNPQNIFLVLISVYSLGRPKIHSAARRTVSMTHSNNSNPLPSGKSAVPQPTATLRAPSLPLIFNIRYRVHKGHFLSSWNRSLEYSLHVHSNMIFLLKPRSSL